MPSSGTDNFSHALSTANTWLADISAGLNTDDRHFSHRALRAWLHTLRDRLTVDAVAKFGAQLPELMRGVYYDGWEPNRNPVKYNADQYVQRFAWEARIPTADVGAVASAITAVLADRLSAGQLEEALAAFPAGLREMIHGNAPFPHGQPSRRAPREDSSERVQEQINTLAEAVRSLARGLEDRQLAGVDSGQVSHGARLADEILMTIGSERR